jgi:hypothetical protein
MPTYHFKCEACEEVTEADIPLGEYHRNPPAFFHCGQQQVRYFPPTGYTAIENALAGDRHYDGLRASDGTDISTRSKQRAYMKANNLTTVDDYKETWAKARKERDDYYTGRKGTITKADIRETIERFEAQGKFR